jgi:sulfatase maturation enzyme AslB (radical SAM superfamily)
MNGSKVVMIDHELELHKNTFVVNWNLGNQCNFRCSYCIPALNSGSNPWPAPEAVTGFADSVIGHFAGKHHKKLLFGFTGGEVTLYKDLYDVLKHLKDNNCKTEILSNASPKLSYWEKIKDVLNYGILSFHADHCRPEHFLEVVQYLRRHISIHVNIMMHPQHFSQCRSFGETIMSTCPNMSISFQPLLEKLSAGAPLIPYSDEQFDAIRHLNASREICLGDDLRYRGQMRNFTADGREYIMTQEQYVTERRNHWKGWYCWAGLEQIVVSQEGNVYRAWCQQDKLGDIYGDIQFPSYPVVCNRNMCHCNIDMMTKKQAPVFINPQNIEALAQSKIG